MNSQNVSSGILSAVMCCTGPAVIVIDAANAAGFSRPQLISWIFLRSTFFGGLMCLVLPLIYKIPIAGAHSITAAAFFEHCRRPVPVIRIGRQLYHGGSVVALVGMSGLFEKKRSASCPDRCLTRC